MTPDGALPPPRKYTRRTAQRKDQQPPTHTNDAENLAPNSFQRNVFWIEFKTVRHSL